MFLVVIAIVLGFLLMFVFEFGKQFDPRLQLVRVYVDNRTSKEDIDPRRLTVTEAVVVPYRVVVVAMYMRMYFCP
jgi:hypothetical protein